MEAILDAVVIGAGQAGLGISYLLKERGFTHFVFERGAIGETWRTQRWDSFALNTPNWSNGLPGARFPGDEPDGFGLRDHLVHFFEDYAERFDLPVRTGMTVIAVGREAGLFQIQVEDRKGERHLHRSKNLVVASGILQMPKIPKMSEALPPGILQMHTGDYRNPDSLPGGGVVIVGSGQSGCQIAEDLAGSGREIYLCTSKVGRLPRRYRGRDITEWLVDIGFWETRNEDLEDPEITKAPQPQISGVGRYGHTVSLQYLAGKGISILGRLIGVENGALIFDDSASEHIHFADTISGQFRQAIDDYLDKEGLEKPPLEPDPADEADHEARSASPIRALDLERAGIRTLIWSTGFTASFDWLNLPALGADGMPLHEAGISPVEGLYFIGFPWLNKRKSGVIYGIEDDARRIVEHIQARV